MPTWVRIIGCVLFALAMVPVFGGPMIFPGVLNWLFGATGIILLFIPG